MLDPVDNDLWRDREGGPDEEQSWVVAYADLLTLLFIYFTLILSVSQVSRSKIEMLSAQLSDKGGVPIYNLRDEIENVLKNENLQNQISTTASKDGLLVQFSDSILFGSGSAELKGKGKEALKSLSKALSALASDYGLSVEGHTVSRPIRNSKYASNWELSAARSLSVVQELIDQGVNKDKLEVKALADTRPLSGELKKNRRVTIVVR